MRQSSSSLLINSPLWLKLVEYVGLFFFAPVDDVEHDPPLGLCDPDRPIDLRETARQTQRCGSWDEAWAGGVDRFMFRSE